MSLFQKLQGDSLRRECEQEVKELHRTFVDWFRGSREQEVLDEDLKLRLSSNFSHVAPNGKLLQGRQALLGHLQNKYGCYRDRVFAIDIYNTQMIWTDNGKSCLCCYEEWQSWQDGDSNSASNNDDTEDSGASTNMQQFGRLSTCLLEKKNSRWTWVHVHETWLEEEEPQHDMGVASTAQDEETIMTGPVMAPQQQEQALRNILAAKSTGKAPNSAEKDVALEPAATAAATAMVVGAAEVGDTDTEVADTDTEVADTAAQVAARSLLLLVSTQSLNKTYLENQQQAETILKATGLPYETFDGADPVNYERRQELFAKSGSYATYPQLFIMNNESGDISFWGDYDAMEGANENETLVEMLSAALAVADETKAENTSKPADLLFGNLVVILTSKQDEEDADQEEQTAREVQTSAILQKYEIVHETVDKGDVDMEDRVLDLMEIASDALDIYPQIFIASEMSGRTVYWGNHQDLIEAERGNSLIEKLLAGAEEAAKPTEEKKGKKILFVLVSSDNVDPIQAMNQRTTEEILAAQDIIYETIDVAGKDDEEDSVDDLLAMAPSTEYPLFYLTDEQTGKSEFWGTFAEFQKAYSEGTLISDLGVADPDAEVVNASASEQNNGSPRLLILLSTDNEDESQLDKQQNAETILQSNQITYETVDAADTDQEERVEELQDLLTVAPGEYPQFFLVDEKTGETSFWGTFADFESASKGGMLASKLQSSPDQPSLDMPSDNAAGTKKLIVLIHSDMSSGETSRKQEKAESILQSREILFETVDAGDPDEEERVEDLMEVSAMEAQYPLFFLMDERNGDSVFWGTFEDLEQADLDGTLSQKLGVESGDGMSRGVASDTFGAATARSALAVTFQDDLPPESAPALPSRNVGDEDKSKKYGAAAVAGATAAGGATAAEMAVQNNDDGSAVGDENATPNVASVNGDDESIVLDEEMDQEQLDAVAATEESAKDPEEEAFLEASQGILVFEEEEDGPVAPASATAVNDINVEELAAHQTSIPNDASKKRHIAPSLTKYAKPLLWEGAMVGISIAGFDIGTSQGPIADETWHHEVGAHLEELAQSFSIPKPRRKICLPEMVFPTAHIALEGHGIWMSWDVNDALQQWAKCHHMIAIHSRIAWQGVSVLKAKDAELWANKRKHMSIDEGASSVFHYDWTFSTPFLGKVEGGEWIELDESGMRTELLTDQSVPILFFDEIILFEDDMHDNGQVQYSVKIRVMPSCAYILARLWVRVDNVIIRVRESRTLIDFFGIQPQIYRDVTWRECWWEELEQHGLPTSVRAWNFEGRETPEWQNLVQQLPLVEPPKDVLKYAVLEYKGNAEPNAE